MPNDEFRDEFQNLLERADSLASEAGRLAGEIRDRMLSVEPPAGEEPDWVDGPRSPVFYLNTAVGYLRTSAYGEECRYAFPYSTFNSDPPPPDQWSCDHYPRHYR
jgi:hypothetical protein